MFEVLILYVSMFELETGLLLLEQRELEMRGIKKEFQIGFWFLLILG
jgi:hypothetical protein